MDTQIPNNSDPSPTIDKIMAHHTRLSEMKWDLPKKVLAMMMLSKAPPSMEVTVQMISQMTADLGANDSLDLDKIVKAMRASWKHTDKQVRPNLTNSEQTNSTWLNKQVTPPNFNISSSSAENLRSSSTVDGDWVEEARGDVEENEEARKMCSNSCSRPRFNQNQTNKLVHPNLLINGYQHLLLRPTLPALQTWDILPLK